MSYIDAYVLAVPSEKLDEYLRVARRAGEIWKEHGALEYVECVGDDVPDGEHTSFPLSVKLQPGEIVIFSWIAYDSREDRDRINELVMNDPRLSDMMKPENMLFDGKRMFWGGFSEQIRL